MSGNNNHQFTVYLCKMPVMPKNCIAPSFKEFVEVTILARDYRQARESCQNMGFELLGEVK